MKALLLNYAERTLTIGETAEPAPPTATQVRVRILEGGICGTDRNLASFIYGRPPGAEPALILGHEAIGVVEATGQLVVPMIRRDCTPACAMCGNGRRDNCLTGDYTERGIAGAHGYLAEYAVDEVADLISIPDSLLNVAVLVEPMSVIEKTFDTVRRLHAGEPRSVLILGAGTIGILCAWYAVLHGFETTVVSTEAGDSGRAALLRAGGVRYSTTLDGVRADAIVEACGSAQMAAAALRCLNNCGVEVILGARRDLVEIPFLEMILGNKIIAGSVNASRVHFEFAARSLGEIPRHWLTPLIHRMPFDRAPQTVLNPPAGAIKTVHVVND